MSSPNHSQPPYPPQANLNAFPALHLYPLDDSFVPKRIALGGGQRVKIARPPNTKTQPGERNGYFDSRVLSRQHAEVWEEGGRIFIKDVKSSNGTFINGERLSPEGRESEPNELKSDDILEFGVDIVSEDNKTVLHRKVVARVACVFPGKGGNGGGGPPLPLPHDQFATMSQAGATFNGMGAPRRPQVPMIHQGLAGLGGMGGGVRAPGRGLTLDHIFSRLQAELAKSRDTGHDLQVLTGALNNIEDTLNGALPPTTLPHFPDAHALPPVRPPPLQRAMSVPALPQVPALSPSVASPPHPPPAPATTDAITTDAIADLQAQLRAHQDALAAHIESIRALEGVLAEQEAMKREVRELREFVGVDRVRERQRTLRGGDSAAEERGKGEDEGNEDEDDEDSDTQSIMTATPHELDAVLEEDEGEGEIEARGAGEDFEQEERVLTEEPEEEDQFEFEDVSLSSAQEDADADALRMQAQRQEEREREMEVQMQIQLAEEREREEQLQMEEQEREERKENMLRERAQTPEPTMDSPSPPPSPPLPLPRERVHGPSSGAEDEISAPASADVSTSESAPTTSTTFSLAELTTRLALLSTQLEGALAASSALQAQHVRAQEVIRGLEGKVAGLEAGAQSPPAFSAPTSYPDPFASPSASDSDPASSAAVTTFPRVVEAPQTAVNATELADLYAQLEGMRAELTLERGRREAWEEGVEARIRQQVGAAGAGVDGEVQGNGYAHAHAEVEEGKLRHRRTGRTASASPSPPRRGWGREFGTDDNELKREHEHVEDDEGDDAAMDDSIRLEQLELGDFRPSAPKAGVVSGAGGEKSLRGQTQAMHPQMTVQTAVGVLILGIAAAAVVWRVKPAA
ncbi:hypothetical protein K438DRAFT_1657075 [Mycena galopus ATCC 62051]|nr:hypothetical protein K438DRAFT_1657075 [Mycena galopus ATCC 62051]